MRIAGRLTDTGSRRALSCTETKSSALSRGRGSVICGRWPGGRCASASPCTTPTCIPFSSGRLVDPERIGIMMDRTAYIETVDNRWIDYNHAPPGAGYLHLLACLH